MSFKVEKVELEVARLQLSGWPGHNWDRIGADAPVSPILRVGGKKVGKARRVGVVAAV